MDFTTQLGGSYRPENHALFTVKKKLQAAEMLVRHPMNDEFIVEGDQAYGYNPEAWSHEEVELDQLGSIATCDVHVVCNELAGNKGHIGADTARCMLYALLKAKPVVLLHKAHFDPEIDKRTLSLLRAKEPQFHVVDLQVMPPQEIQRVMRAIIRDDTNYDLTGTERGFIQTKVQKHIRDLA